jgi:signal transduction histidine kinase
VPYNEFLRIWTAMNSLVAGALYVRAVRTETAYGGRIWIESEHGAGSVFHCTVPSASVERLTEPVGVRGSML